MTQFVEEKALLLAMEDMDADSGNHEPLDEYLRENFLRGELRKLEEAADLLSNRATIVRREGEAAAREEGADTR